jgi:hypothetical protein
MKNAKEKKWLPPKVDKIISCYCLSELDAIYTFFSVASENNIGSTTVQERRAV